MLDGVDPAILVEIRHSAEHVSGIKKVLDVKARWLGHKLHADVAILVDDALSVAKADQLGDTLKREMLAHIPALSVVNVRCQGSELPAENIETPSQVSGHHHAPEPFKVISALTDGRLEIADTPKGERIRLTLDHPIEGLQASVRIDRAGGKVESLPLVRRADNSLIFESDAAPAEPHEFRAQLLLKVGERENVLHFSMTEPAAHRH